MKKIEKFEKAKKEKKTYKEANVNLTLGQAYFVSQDADYDLINFDDVIWYHDVEEIVNQCRELNITMITITSGFSGMIEILGAFDKLGCKIIGMTNLKKTIKWGETVEYKPAIILKI